jgi:hypothetical protein
VKALLIQKEMVAFATEFPANFPAMIAAAAAMVLCFCEGRYLRRDQKHMKLNLIA